METSAELIEHLVQAKMLHGADYITLVMEGAKLKFVVNMLLTTGKQKEADEVAHLFAASLKNTIEGMRLDAEAVKEFMHDVDAVLTVFLIERAAELSAEDVTKTVLAKAAS